MCKMVVLVDTFGDLKSGILPIYQGYIFSTREGQYPGRCPSPQLEFPGRQGLSRLARPLGQGDVLAGPVSVARVRMSSGKVGIPMAS
jgi:hypothetical protein